MARILVVDDEDMVLMTLCSLVELTGHEPVGTNDGTKALELIKSDEEFAVLLTDLSMAPVDGLELLRAASETRPDMPVVMVTAYSTDEAAEKAREIGAFDYVVKPFKVDRLLDTVNRAIDASPAATA